MLPSASLGQKYALYEPIHGSAPDIAGKGIANPIATILSVAMMLKYTFDLQELGTAIEVSVKQVLKEGHRTADLSGKVSTSQMGDLIVERIKI